MSFLGFTKSNSKIQNGYISNSDIDMNTKVITNHGSPSTGTDVVNKTYCDANNKLPIFNTTLNSTSWTNILIDQEGVFTVTVRNGMSGGPCGSFQLAKNHPSRGASIVRYSSSAGITTEERLEIRWLPGSGIDLRKTGVNYDGTYTVNYIENS